MKRVEIQRIDLSRGSVFSKGIGIDEDGEVVDFIGHTVMMQNILDDLEDFEDNPEIGRPAVYLESWQVQ